MSSSSSLRGVIADGATLDGVVRSPPRNSGEPDGGADDMFVAVVHTADTVRLVAGYPSRGELLRQLADYVSRCGHDELWSGDAGHVRALLAGGELEAAIEHYFATVGQRWDKEWLVTARVCAGVHADQELARQRSGATGTVYWPAARPRSAVEPRATTPCPPPSVQGDR